MQVFRHTPRHNRKEKIKGVLSTSSSGFKSKNTKGTIPHLDRSAEPKKELFKVTTAFKEDLGIVALELGETVAEKVTIVELTEIIKENKYFKENVELLRN
ncbi:hypothetical protein TNIN_314371 [Trichonephila inaurata madagascariensis]|uniref:Uncharacterized protein n=1 Tax=Trichonephila inaurata madagascariensis TaxID=2747483 RepID=A0A8X7CDH3_9ARAC|nr:hypothetical protein TNIN_314371 [Trichonephila inaurata madagascariensis]